MTIATAAALRAAVIKNQVPDRAVQDAFDARAAENNALLAAAETRGGGLLASEQRTFDENLTELEGLKALLEDMKPIGGGGGPAAMWQQAANARPNDRPGESADAGGYTTGPLGWNFDQRDLRAAFEAVADRRQFAIRAAITQTAAPMSTVPDYELDAFPILRDKLRLLDYIPSRLNAAPNGVYFRATTAADAAAPVAAGANKPESSPVWESVPWRAEKIAHWGKAHDEVVADWDGFLQTVSEEFLAGLIDEETDQLLNGTGTTPQLRGIMNTSGIQLQDFDTNIIVTAAKAVTKLRTGTAKVEPDLFVFNTGDWEKITTFRTGGSTSTDGPFLVNPLESPKLELWGVPMVVTTRLAAGHALAANMKTATRAEIRQTPTVEVAPGTSEAEWKANITLIRAEERLALKIPRPGAIVSFETVDTP